ncbi:MAG: guanylate kinase [bacterium]|nr:guanylate kinase [bacterium]
MNEKKRNVLVIAGPTGSGKNSVIDGVLGQCQKCTRLVTATTRAMREGERNGIDYYFLSKEEFLKAVKDGQIPEYWHAKETDRHYGTYLPDLEKKISEGKIVVAHMQIEGARYFKKHYNALTLFIVPDSLDELRRRVLGRQRDIPDEELEERLKIAEVEMSEHAPEYDYTIVNRRDKLNEAIDDVLDILKKEKYL